MLNLIHSHSSDLSDLWVLIGVYHMNIILTDLEEVKDQDFDLNEFGIELDL